MVGFLEQTREGLVSLMLWFLNNVTEMEAADQAEAALYERAGNRKAYRIGYKPRTLKAPNCMLNPRKP